MEDRFRFRVWDSQDREYDYNVQNISLFDRDEDYITIFRCIERDKLDVTLEQCTGLKDKNGKLIYEGDIVETHDYTTEHSQIVFDKGCYVLKSKDVAVYEHLSNYENECEIIGTIHENPELLEAF